MKLLNEIISRFTVLFIKLIENNTWMCGNMKFISSVDQDIAQMSKANEWDILFNTRNKYSFLRSGILEH